MRDPVAWEFPSILLTKWYIMLGLSYAEALDKVALSLQQPSHNDGTVLV